MIKRRKRNRKRRHVGSNENIEDRNGDTRVVEMAGAMRDAISDAGLGAAVQRGQAVAVARTGARHALVHLGQDPEPRNVHAYMFGVAVQGFLSEGVGAEELRALLEATIKAKSDIAAQARKDVGRE